MILELNLVKKEGFKRIVEVVVLESIRQGYHTIGSIVWTTFLDKVDAEDALRKLLEKGLIVKNEKRELLQRVPQYDLVPGLAKKVSVTKKSLLGIKTEKLPATVNALKQLSLSIQTVRSTIQEEDIEKTIESFDNFIDPSKS